MQQPKPPQSLPKKNVRKLSKASKSNEADEDDGLSLHSAIPGRERWRTEAILKKPGLARELQKSLRQHAGIIDASANPNTGGILVFYSPDASVAGGGLRALIRESLRELSLRKLDTPSSALESDPLYRILKTSLLDKKQLTGPIMLSLAGNSLSTLQGLSLVATMNTAHGRGPSFLRFLGLTKTASRLTFMTGLSLALTAASAWMQYSRRQAWRKLAHTTQHNLRTRLLTHIETQDLAFFDTHGTGRVMKIIIEDTAQIGEFVERAGDEVIEKALTTAVGTTALIASSPRLALLAAIPLPIFLTIGSFFRQTTSERYKHAAQLSANYTQSLENNFAGIATVKSFAAEQHEIERLRESEWNLERSALDASIASSRQAHMIRGIFAAGFCMTAGVGGQLVASGKISEAEYNRSMYWVPHLLSALGGIDETMQLYHRATQSAKTLEGILNTQPDIRSGPVRLPLKKKLRGQIDFEDVSFGYDPSTKVLENISFAIKPGETLGIVGSTGSGKSTLLRLLLRFYEVNSGRILLDGRDIRELNLQDLRSAIGFVSQDVYLFQGSVRNNILYGQPHATKAKIIDVMTKAGAKDLLQSLPGGLEAEVGERGQRLSGGERQRVAIARALLKQSPVLALDEATAHLDYETEAAVKKSLRTATAGKSVILIAHRLSTIRDADKILVLEKGSIREEGTHQQLVAKRGLYASLWQLQNGKH